MAFAFSRRRPQDILISRPRGTGSVGDSVGEGCFVVCNTHIPYGGALSYATTTSASALSCNTLSHACAGHSSPELHFDTCCARVACAVRACDSDVEQALFSSLACDASLSPSRSLSLALTQSVLLQFSGHAPVATRAVCYGAQTACTLHRANGVHTVITLHRASTLHGCCRKS